MTETEVVAMTMKVRNYKKKVRFVIVICLVVVMRSFLRI